MYFMLFVHVYRANDATHSLSESFICTKLRPGKKCVFSIRDFNGYLIFRIPFYVFCDVHNKGEGTTYMSDYTRMLYLCVTGDGLSIDKDNSREVYSLKFKEDFFIPVFFAEAYFFSVPGFSSPATFACAGILVGIAFIETVRNADRFPLIVFKCQTCYFLV